MMPLPTGIDNQRAFAAPMLVDSALSRAVDVSRRIATGKGYPKEVAQGRGGELTVVNDDDQRKATHTPLVECSAKIIESSDFSFWRTFDDEHSRHR